MSKLKTDNRIQISLEFGADDVTPAETWATYGEIKTYIWEKYKTKVSRLYIAQIKRKYGLEMGENYNLPRKDHTKALKCPVEKERLIVEALEHFNMLPVIFDRK